MITETREETKTAFRVLAAISFCHLLNDMMQSVIPAVYPILKQSYHLVSADLERSTVADHLQEFCGSLALLRSESSKAERPHAKIAA